MAKFRESGEGTVVRREDVLGRERVGVGEGEDEGRDFLY